MANILVVCTANICRSPVCESVVRDRLHQRGLNDWEVASAGTWATFGQSASYYSIEILSEQGLDITDHKSRPVGKDLLEWADLILCMELGHVEALQIEFPGLADKIFTLSEMSGPGYSVYDPYGEPRPAYEAMVNEVTKLVQNGLDRIVQLAQDNEGQRISDGGGD